MTYFRIKIFVTKSLWRHLVTRDWQNFFKLDFLDLSCKIKRIQHGVMTSKKKKELNSFPYLLLTHVTCSLKSKRKEKLKQDEIYLSCRGGSCPIEASTSHYLLRYFFLIILEGKQSDLLYRLEISSFSVETSKQIK